MCGWVFLHKSPRANSEIWWKYKNKKKIITGRLQQDGEKLAVLKKYLDGKSKEKP